MPDAPAPEPNLDTLPPERRKRGRAWWLLAIPLAMLVLGAFGIFERQHSETRLRQWTDAAAIPTVAVVSPQKMPGLESLKLPGNVQAFYEAPIYARVDGYLHAWYRDIGAHVRRGEVLATIDTPELDQQLIQTQARVASAAADQRLAALTASRWRALLATRSVAEQTVDEKEGEAEARMASLKAAQADVSRLQAMESFKTIVAPFDGIVTARRTDIGALITAGSGEGRELFRVADVHEMRVYVPVPQSFIADLHPGTKATLSLPQYPAREFPATLETSENAVNVNSRTALFELLAPNRDGALWPGTYAQVSFQVTQPVSGMSVPAGALIFQSSGPQLAVLGPDNRVQLRDVHLGRDTGTLVEIRSGIGAKDRIIDNPPDSLSEGELVQPAANKAEPGSGK